jgi:hypothetical protein
MRTRLSPGQTIQKAFSWSYSKLKNYRTCPKRYYLIDVTKKYKEDFTGEALAWGDQVHKAFEKAIKDNAKFPKGMEHFEEAATRLRAGPGKKLVEQKLAIKKDLSPCDWFDKEAWFRGIADFLSINGKVALAIDYKTGKIIEDSEQLALLAECVFSHYPEVEAVRTEFWWLKDDAATVVNFFRKNRQETWRRVLPEVMTLEKAHAETNFPPIQSGLCRKHCIVTECPFNGNK